MKCIFSTFGTIVQIIYIYDKGYIYCGSGSYLDTDEYDPDSWTSKTNCPLPARDNLAASTINDKGYIYCGYSAIQNSSLFFDCNSHNLY